MVILSAPRTGAHLLRGMLSADPGIVDLGAPWHLGESNAPRLVAGDFASARAFIAEIADAYPNQIIVSNVKIGVAEHSELVRAYAGAGARFVRLYRRDRLAQVASFVLAAQHQCFYGPAPAGATITLKPERVAQQLSDIERGELATCAMLAGLPHVELAFEDLLDTQLVEAALSGLVGRPLRLGQPTTIKSAPPLRDYVTNLDEFR